MSDSYNVLIVEDLPTDAELCQREVSKALPDCTFRRVETRDEYLAAIEEFKPDIILSDYKMPAFDGMTALKLALQHAPETPFIMVTGSVNEDTAVECMKAGAWDYVIKEHVKRLGNAVVTVLKEKKLRDEKKKADEELRKTASLLAEVQEISKLGGWEVDLVTGHATWTKETYRIFGLSEGIDLKDLIKLFGYYAEEDRELIRNAFNRAVERGEGYDLELRLNRADGRQIWVRTTGKPVMEDGKVVRIAGNIMDITERRLARDRILLDELRLQELLQLYRLEDKTMPSIMGHALEACTKSLQSPFAFIGLMDRDETVMTIHTWSKEAMAECLISDKPMHFPIAEAGLWGEVVRQRRPIIENDYAHSALPKKGYPAGHVPIVNFLSVPVIKDNRIVAVAAVANKKGDYDSSDANALIMLLNETWDLIAQQRSEESILRSKMLLQDVIDSTPDWMYVKDSEHRYMMVNRSFASAQGLTPQEMIGHADTEYFSDELCYGDPVRGITGYHEDDRNAFQGKIVHNPRNIISWKDGTEHIYDTFKIPLSDHQGMIYGVLVYSRDITERQKAEDERTAAFNQLQKTLDDFITAMSKIVEMRDPYTAGHQARVAELSVAIAGEMGLPDEKIKYIRVAALIHDIGKIYVPSDILSKPGKLSEIEWQLIRTHAQGSYDILKTIEFPWPVAEIALQHHERINGSGYPNGLAGDRIMLEARIIAVADVVEAMASHRPYRQALGIETALNEIIKNSGILYQAEVVDACRRLFEQGRFKLPD